MAFYINTGAVKVPLEDNLGRTFGYAVYVPSDVGIIERYQKGLSIISEMEDSFKEIAEKVTPENVFEMIAKPCQYLKKFCDFVFGSGFYESAFSEINPFTETPSGDRVCILVIQSIVEDIKDKSDKRKEKESKYLAGYKNTAEPRGHQNA